MTSQFYYVDSAGTVQGPCTTRIMQEAEDCGWINDETLIIRDDDGTRSAWVCFKECRDWFAREPEPETAKQEPELPFWQVVAMISGLGLVLVGVLWGQVWSMENEMAKKSESAMQARQLERVTAQEVKIELATWLSRMEQYQRFTEEARMELAGKLHSEVEEVMERPMDRHLWTLLMRFGIDLASAERGGDLPINEARNYLLGL